jgi:HSP20 family protein
VSRLPSPFRRKKDDDDPFADFFADFEKEFSRMQHYMNDLIEEALKNADVPKGAAKPGNPFMYGFTMRLGPDGKPRIEPFGNTPATHSPEVAVEGGREPLTDLIEHDDHYAMTVELPGVEREDIQVFATDHKLTIKVDTAARRYFKEVDLGAAVKPDSTGATFKNGVLDVMVKKQERRPPAESGFRVNVK